MENSTNETESGAGKQSPLVIPGAILLAGVIIAGAVMYSGGAKTAQAPNSKEQAGSVAAAASEDAKKALTAEAGDFVLGDPAATVTLVEFADFQCPFCGKLFKETLPSVKENYVKTGKVRFIFRDFAFLGDESFRAAEAARCAGEQDKFWDYHDYLYGHQKGENQGAFSDDNLKKFAGILKLDQTSFDACLDSGKYRDLVEKESKAGQELGVTGTPTTFINGVAAAGAIPFSDLSKKIDAALSEAGR